MVRCSMAETEATVTEFSPFCPLSSREEKTSSRFCSVRRETASVGRKQYSLRPRQPAGRCSMLRRSLAKFSAAVSSGQITNSGRSIVPQSAAARFARCTAERPEISAGSPPPSSKDGRAASSL